MDSEVKVIQADREAAADFSKLAAECTDNEPAIRDCRAGKLDDTAIVQAFARHADPLRKRIAELEGELTQLVEAFEAAREGIDCAFVAYRNVFKPVPGRPGIDYSARCPADDDGDILRAAYALIDDRLALGEKSNG
jgi:hypothetical protein